MSEELVLFTIYNTQRKWKTTEGVVDPVTDDNFFRHYTMISGLEHMFPKVLKIVSTEGHPREEIHFFLKHFDFESY